MLPICTLVLVPALNQDLAGVACTVSTSRGVTRVVLGQRVKLSLEVPGVWNGASGAIQVRDKAGVSLQVAPGPFPGSALVTRNFRAGQAPDKWTTGPNVSATGNFGPSTGWNSPYAIVGDQGHFAVLTPDLQFQAESPVHSNLDGLTIGPCSVLRRGKEWKPGSWTKAARLRTLVWFEDAPDGRLAAERQVQTKLWNLSTKWRRARSDPQFLPWQVVVKETNEFNARPEEMSRLVKPGTIVKPNGLRWTTDPDTQFGHPAFQSRLSFKSDENALRAAWGLLAWGKEKRQTSWVARAESVAAVLVAKSPEGGFVGSVSTQNADESLPATLTDQATTALAALDFTKVAPDSPSAKGLLERAVAVAHACKEADPMTTPMVALLARSRELGVDLLSDGTTASRANKALWATTTDETGARLDAVLEVARPDPAPYRKRVEALVTSTLRQQALWDRTSEPQAPTFGSFGDGFGTLPDSPEIAVGLIRLGCLYQNREWIDRGAFGLRAMFGLWSASFGTAHLPVESEVPFWRAAPGTSPGEFLPRTSWEGAEGRYVALLRQAAESAGGYYAGPGAPVGLDGCAVRPDGKPALTLAGASVPFFQDFTERPRGAADGLVAKFLTYPAISHWDVKFDNGKPIAFASPGLSMPEPSLVTKVQFSANGRVSVGVAGAEGFSARGVQFPARCEVSGTYDGIRFQSVAFLSYRPLLKPSDVFPFGWRRFGQASHVLVPSLPAVSTADNGSGAADASLVTTIVSKEVWSDGSVIDLQVAGTPDCSLRLVDAKTGATVSVHHPQRDAFTRLKLRAESGTWCRVELVDSSRTGWIAVK